MTHKTCYRVYYEDTDAGGVVYYANYLKFAERARTELLRENGVDQSQLVETRGIMFVVRRVSMELNRPAKLDDMLCIETIVEKISGASILMKQLIMVDDNLFSEIKVQIACVNQAMRPTRLPEDIHSKILK